MNMQMKKIVLVPALLLLVAAAVSAQRQPPAYVLSAGDKAVIVLGDTPRFMDAFTVFRKGPGDKDFLPISETPVRAVDDPSIALELMGGDFDWISRRVETVDPDTAWRRIRTRPDLGQVLSLVSNGLRMALGRTFFDLQVVSGRTYQYRIVFLDSTGREISRAEKQVMIAAPAKPGAPTRIAAATGARDVTLTWSYPAFSGGDADLTVGFNVSRQEPGKPSVLLTPSPVLRIEGMLRFQDTTPAAEKPVTYAVQAVDIIGILSDPALSPQVTYRDTTPPMVPQGVTAVDQKDGVLLVWKTSPEIDADHYVVFRSARQDSGYRQINTNPIPVTQPRFLDTTAARGVAGYYKVTVVRKNNIPSEMSASAVIIPQKTVPPAQVQGVKFSVDAQKRSVSFTWNPVNEPDIKGYLVFRGESRDGMLRMTPKPIAPDAKPSWTDTGYQGQGLPTGKTMIYAIAAVDASLNEGKPAFVEVPIPDTQPPSPALALTARSTKDGRVSLLWQPSLSGNMAKHRIQRKTDGAYAVVAELGVEATQWTDETAEKGKRYTYRVIELNTADVESAPSPESTVTVTDAVPPEAPSGLSAELGPKGVTLSWKPSPAKDAAGYFVYRAQYKGAQFIRITDKPVAETTWLDARGQKDSVYAVSAADTSGNEGTKATVQVKVQTQGGKQ